ncbi:MAG: siderophore-interacting protein [Myxococcales bacterium]
MASGKAFLGELFGKLFFRQAQIVALSEPGPFRRMTLEGVQLRDVAWTPGDKVQVFLPAHGMRTYTPLSWDPKRGVTELLVFLHGDSPGALWGRKAQVGDAVQFFGPRRSIDADALPARVVLFGDETSFAVASALRTKLGADQLACVFEVTPEHAAQPVLSALQLEASVTVAKRSDDSHLGDVHGRLAELTARAAGAQLVMTGRAAAIQALRARMKRDGGTRVAASKAYWALGKRGLD